MVQLYSSLFSISICLLSLSSGTLGVGIQMQSAGCIAVASFGGNTATPWSYICQSYDNLGFFTPGPDGDVYANLYDDFYDQVQTDPYATPGCQIIGIHISNPPNQVTYKSDKCLYDGDNKLQTDDGGDACCSSPYVYDGSSIPNPFYKVYNENESSG